MPRTRTRDRQLRRLAERRMAERRRRRRQRILTGVVAGVIALIGFGLVARAFLFRDENPEVNEAAQPKGGGVACNAQVPSVAKQEKPTFQKPPKMQIDLKMSYRVVMRTSCGEVTLQLFDDRTPKTVNNFLFLVRKGFYDGLTFHRIVRDFVVQGGDPKGDGSGGPGYQFEDEIVKGLKFDSIGLLAMANSGPDTNGSQFFITTGDAAHLNGKHTIFGRILEGADVVSRLNALKVDEDSKPTQTAYIEEITIIQK
jgi:peptidyl-prolyl cis-trans isomerase B (cyclophilin B)